MCTLNDGQGININYIALSDKQLSKKHKEFIDKLVAHKLRRKRVKDIYTLTGFLGLIGVGLAINSLNFLWACVNQSRISDGDAFIGVLSILLSVVLISVCIYFERRYKSDQEYYETQINQIYSILKDKS
jgi:predicted nucleic-acid-binding protein